MASTSTNKQPLLIDRPISRGRLITGQTVSNIRTPGIGVTLLVSCLDNDGAIIDSARIISASSDVGEVVLYLSTAGNSTNVTNGNAWPVGYINIAAPVSPGTAVELDLPELMTPVPAVGTEPKNRGILIEKGQILVAAKIGTPWASGHYLALQGGFY